MNCLGCIAVLAITLAVVVAGPTSRIVGGRDAEPLEIPYQVSYQFVENNGNIMHWCGGSILRDPTSTNSSRFVLTAGHCKLNLRRNSAFAQIVAGEHDFRFTSGFEQKRRVAAFEVHGDYEFAGGPHDLAVVKMDAPLVFNEAIQPIDLPKWNAVPEGEAIISGWGSMSTTGWPNNPTVLQTVVLPIIDRAECRRLWEDRHTVHVENVCAGPLDGSSAVCSGDSGGPLVQRVNNRTVQIGIVSWGAVPCGEPNRPGVFGRVSAYIDWIEGTIKRLL